MGTADEQIRVSDTVKRELDRRRREGESYNDVLERILADDRDLLAGTGRWSDEQADRVREARETARQKSKELHPDDDGVRSSPDDPRDFRNR